MGLEKGSYPINESMSHPHQWLDLLVNGEHVGACEFGPRRQVYGPKPFICLPVGLHSFPSPSVSRLPLDQPTDHLLITYSINPPINTRFYGLPGLW